MESNVKVKFNRSQKKLTVEITDLAFMTPWQPHLLGEILTSIQDVLDPRNDKQFKYYKDGKETYGWRAEKKD